MKQSRTIAESKQLNILEMMGCRRAHNHRSVDSLASEAIILPDVSNNGQYDSLTISRVVSQLAENTQRITQYIKDKASSIGSTNLGNYITTNTLDENGAENKIFVSAPCTMTSQRTLALKNSTDLSINNMPEVLASFMMEEYTYKTGILICMTKPSSGNPSRIIRIDLTSISPEIETLYDASKDSTFGNVDFKEAGYADSNNQFLYVITNKDIRLWNCNDLRNKDIQITNSDKFLPCNIVDFYNSFSNDHKRYNDNLVIEDLHRQSKIQELINNGNFHEFVNKYFKLGNFPKDVLKPEFYSDCINYDRNGVPDPINTYTGKPVIVYDVGIVTGKYGIYQIQCYSAKSKVLNEFEIDYNEKVGRETGSLHIRCLDDKPVSNAFFYRDKGDLFLIAINGWPKSDSHYSKSIDDNYKGLTVLKLDKTSSASRIYTLKDNETPSLDSDSSWNKISSDGWIKHSRATNNVNQVLNAKGVNGSYVNRIQWAIGTYRINNRKTRGIFLKDSARASIADGMNGWFVPLTDHSLYNVTKSFNRNEFNCLSEFKISNASYYDKQEMIVLDIDQIGIVEGNKTSDRDNATGFRFNILKNDIYGLKQLFLMNNCFVGIDETHIYFITSSGDFNSITLGSDLSTSLGRIQYATSYESSNTLCLGNGNKITLLYLKYRIETSKYTNLITGDLTKIIKSNFLDGNNIISKSIANHISVNHGPDSVITKLNNLIALLKGKSILESTGFSENNHMSYIILNYPNNGDDFEFVTTNENSTDMYGRINSKTVNADLKLVTELRRNSDAISYYDTVLDTSGNELFSTNVLTYNICRLSSIMTKINVNVPTTGTFYVDNVIGWSNGSRSGSSLKRKNLSGGYMHGKIESMTTRYQLVLNKNYFNIKNVLNVTAQLVSAPLKIYSNKIEFDSRHYGMYDSPIIAPLNVNVLDENLHYDISKITNDEITLDFIIYGGDSLQLNILVQNN